MFKKNERRVKEKPIKKESGHSLPIMFFMSLIVAVIVYLVALNMEKNLLSNYEKTKVFVVATQIPQHTVIEKEDLATYFTIKEIDKSIVPESYVTNLEDLCGQSTYFDMLPGSLITSEMFYPIDELYKKFSKPREIGLSANDVSQSVSGVIRAGDRVDVYVIQKNKESEIVTSSIAKPIYEGAYVVGAYDANGIEIESSNLTTPCQKVNIVVEAADADMIYKNLQKGGTLYLSRVVDVDDKLSK